MAIACLAPHHISSPFPSPPRTEPTSNMSPQRFVSSPYLSDEHHLDLSSVTKASQQLAVALSSLRPIADDYPSQPYPTSFNWQEIIDQLPSEFTGTLMSPEFLISKGNSVVSDSIQLSNQMSTPPNYTTSIPWLMPKQISLADC